MDKARGRHLRTLIILISENDLANSGRQMEAPYRNLDLSTEGKAKLRMNRTITAWGPQGETLEFEPCCHVRLYLGHDLDDNVTSLIGSCYFGGFRGIVYSN